MKELINATLLQNRHPIRAKAFIGMADVLIEAGFENRFVEVYSLISGSDSSAEIIEKLEEVIVQCAFNFFQRTGIIINTDNIYNKPVEANEIIQALDDADHQNAERGDTLLPVNHGERSVIAALQHERPHIMQAILFYEKQNILPQFFPLVFLPRIIALIERNAIDFPVADQFAERDRLRL